SHTPTTDLPSFPTRRSSDLTIITHLFWPHCGAAAAADSPVAKTSAGFVSRRRRSGGHAKAGLSTRDGGNVVLGKTRSGSFRLTPAGGDRSRLRSGENRNSAHRNPGG